MISNRELTHIIANFIIEYQINDYCPIEGIEGEIVGCYNTKYHGYSGPNDVPDYLKDNGTSIVNPPVDEENRISVPTYVIAYIIVRNGEELSLILYDEKGRSYNVNECLGQSSVDSIERHMRNVIKWYTEEH